MKRTRSPLTEGHQYLDFRQCASRFVCEVENLAFELFSTLPPRRFVEDWVERG
jgi:hypothetical protein